MPLRPRLLQIVAVGSLMAILAGCTYSSALRQLSPEERTTFHAYSKMMTPGQAYAYLGKATAAERVAYLEDIGLAQRFRALDAPDREAVLAGYPRPGISAEALRFLWGKPAYTSGRTGHYEYWYYFGSSFSLGEYGNRSREAGSEVVVQLVDNRVVTWLDTVPTNQDKGDGIGLRF